VYEEMWHMEESALWDWLEDRVGMNGLAYPVNSELSNADGSKRARKQKEGLLKGKGRDMAEKVKGMSEREVDWAIDRTEDKLRVLKGVVEKAKSLREADSEEKASESGDV
jgi:hypothetical protein